MGIMRTCCEWISARFISLYQIEAALALRIDAGFDQRDDRRHAHRTSLGEMAEEVLRKRVVARASLPKVNERRRVHTKNVVRDQDLV